MRRPAGHKQPFSFRDFPDSASSLSIPVSASTYAIPYITYKIWIKEINNRKQINGIGGIKIGD